MAATNHNAYDTKGVDVMLSHRNHFMLGSKPFQYGISGTMTFARSRWIIYPDQPNIPENQKVVGKPLGAMMAWTADGLYRSEEEIDNSAWYGTRPNVGDIKYVDINGDGIISVGANSVKNPGDRKILGNSIASLQYGLTAGFDYMGIDFSIFFQGTGNHYWYPNDESMAFWGPYSRPYCTYLPYDFLDNVWSEENPDAYFPRPRAYSAFTSGHLAVISMPSRSGRF